MQFSNVVTIIMRQMLMHKTQPTLSPKANPLLNPKPKTNPNPNPNLKNRLESLKNKRSQMIVQLYFYRLHVPADLEPKASPSLSSPMNLMPKFSTTFRIASKSTSRYVRLESVFNAEDVV